MAYRKLWAPQLFTNGQLLQDQVLILGPDGVVADLVSPGEAGDGIEWLDGLLCPGFVNAHCHTELSHMRQAIPENTGMVPFLMQVMFGRQQWGEPQKQEAIRAAIEAMWQNGIVAVGDICNTADSAQPKAGACNMYFHNFIEVSGFTPAGAGARFGQALETQEQFLSYFPPGQVSITPHAPYSVSAKLFGLIAAQNPSIISIHSQESQAEDEFIRHKGGGMLELYKALGADIGFFEPQQVSSLSYILPLLPQKAKTILVHNCLTNATDLLEIEKAGRNNGDLFVCLCPHANLYIGNPLPDMALLQQSSLPICIGTDSLASNHQLSILTELQALQAYFPFLPTASLLQWATLNGAHALDIGDRYGSFEKGKRPGVLLLENMVGGKLAGARVRRVL